LLVAIGTRCGEGSIWWFSTVGSGETSQHLSPCSRSLAARQVDGGIVALEVEHGIASSLVDLSNAFTRCHWQRCQPATEAMAPKRN
jgi:hypothetical protein